MEDVLNLLFAYFWIWIPIVAILAGSFKEWLKHKEKLAELRASTGNLEGDVSQLRAERDALVDRIQNLEAIVTHEVWEAAQNELDPAVKAARIDAALLEKEPDDAERAQQLASRLRGI